MYNLSYENAPLAEVLNDISKFSNQNFVFKKKDLRGKSVSIDLENVPLKASVASLLEEHNFEFEKIGQGIMAIRAKPAVAVVPVAKAEVVMDAPVIAQMVEAVVELVEEPTPVVKSPEKVELSVVDKLIQQLEDPTLAKTIAQFQKRHVNWLQEEGLSMDQAVEVVLTAAAAERLLEAQM